MTRHKVLSIGLAAVGFLLLGVSGARADDCAALGGNIVGTECVIDGTAPGTPPNTRSGSFTIAETLRIAGTGIITVGPPSITIDVTNGDFIMENGAMIDGNVNSGNCPSGSDITITVDNGNVNMKPGSTIRSNSCHGGDIVITAPKSSLTTGRIDIDGLIESVGSLTGTGANQGLGGGTITVVAACSLLVSDEGVLSSRGRDAGADLIHLEACTVEIDGLVESTGPAHATPNNPTNHCDSAFRPDKPANSTACVEIWAGDSLTINSVAPHNGEVHADIGTNGQAGGFSWVDVFARGTVRIIGDTSGPYAVHANNGAGNTVAGTVHIASLASTVGMTDWAVQANDAHAGSMGGDVIIEAGGAGSPGGDVNFGPIAPGGPASVQAIGDVTFNCPSGKGGGHITVQSFNGVVKGTGGELNATGDNIPGNCGTPGVVKLTGCGTGAPGDGVAYTGTVTPNPPDPVQADSCGGSPTLAAYVALPAANCTTLCTVRPTGSKSGAKFNDLDNSGTRNGGEPGLNGWVIHLFGTLAAGGNFHATQTTHTATVADQTCTLGEVGCYFFGGLDPGTYHVCEVLKPGWNQTFPGVAGFDCDGPPNPDADNLTPGPRGHTFTITAAGENFTGNNFGNHTDVICEKLPVQTVLSPTGTQYPNNLGPDYIVRVNQGDSVQAAVDAAALANSTTTGDKNNDGYIIIVVLAHDDGTLGGSAAQTVVIDKTYTRPFALIGCSVTLTGGGAGAAIEIKSTATDPGILISESASGKSTIFLMDLHGGSSGVGVKVDGDHRYLRNEGASNNAGAGFLINGSFNTMHNGAANNNGGDGVSMTGSSNYLTDTNSMGNGGNGFNIVGNSNKLLKLDAGEKSTPNSLDGVHVVGNSNTLTENDAYNNGGDGIDVAGSSNILSKNVAGDKGKGNSGSGFRISGLSNNLTENKASANSVDGFTLSGGLASATANLLKNNVSNAGNQASDLENGGAEYRMTNYIKNNGGGNKANNIVVPKTTAPTMCAAFPATNATTNFAAAMTCE